jgi:zinc/manganese transport system ATP-binding protein
VNREPATVGRGAVPTAGPPASAALVLEGAGVQLGGRWIWRDVDLRVDKHEFVAILGPNGAGKSTFLRVVLGLEPLGAGTVDVLGSAPTRGNAGIGYLPQRRTFDRDVRLRGRDLVRLGLDGGRWGIPLPFRRAHNAAARQRVDEVVELVDAGAYAHRSIGELSGGEQQRLLIAQALIDKPSILLLDEPLESLDIPSQQGVASLIQRICREQGVTVLLVAHDINPILPFVDRVIYIAGGHTAIGSPSEVVTTETLSQLYGARVEVLTTTDGRIVVVGQPEGVSFHGHG